MLQSGRQRVVKLTWQKWMMVLSLVTAITSPTLQSLWLASLLCVCVWVWVWVGGCGWVGVCWLSKLMPYITAHKYLYVILQCILLQPHVLNYDFPVYAYPWHVPVIDLIPRTSAQGFRMTAYHLVQFKLHCKYSQLLEQSFPSLGLLLPFSPYCFSSELIQDWIHSPETVFVCTLLDSN